MGLKQTVKRVIPEPVRHVGWRGYYKARNDWLEPRLKTIVGCQTTTKIVALTFDDGPNPEFTPRILDILKHYQVKATFFMLGRNVAKQPKLARTVAESGHAVGNHTFTHPYIPDLSANDVAHELTQCQKTIQQATGVSPQHMRPPFGAQGPMSFLMARLVGLQIVHWSASGEDWQGEPASTLTERILSDIRPGGIILLHDSWEPPAYQTEWRPEYELFQDRTPTIEALPIVIEHLHRQGYRFVTVPEMMKLGLPIGESRFV